MTSYRCPTLAMDMNGDGGSCRSLDVSQYTIDDLIANQLYAKAIQWLSHYINVEFKSSGGRQSPINACPPNGQSNNLYRYLLLRSYCYYRLRLGAESTALAIDDVMEAIGVADEHFQSYLLGALILIECNRYEESLEMFEKTLRLNPNLLAVLTDKLVYLKFKILTDSMGFAEEAALRTAMSCRYLNDCMDHIQKNDLNSINEFNVLKYIDINNNEIILNIKNTAVDCRHRSWTDSVSTNDDNTYYSQTNGHPFIDQWLRSMTISDNTIDTNNGDGDHLLMRPNIGGYSSSSGGETLRSNQWPVVGTGGHRLTTDSHKSVQVLGPQEVDNTLTDTTRDGTVSEDSASLDIEFRELLANNNGNTGGEEPWIAVKNNKWRSVQRWIDNNTDTNGTSASNASKLCSFDPELSPDISLRPSGQQSAASRVRTVSTSSNAAKQNVDKTDQSGEVTNILKLRGVYIGNLRPNCPQKSLLDVCKRFGTVVDFYHPSGECYAFVHYRTAESATQLIAQWNGQPLDEQCIAGRALVARFTPSQEQMSKYNSMSYNEYKRHCNERPYSECDRWRSGKRCPYDHQCPYRHVLSNRAIDTLPDKRKSKWKVN